jgi:uncharacterized protein with von Willebrand factor type A (vWA) domain
MVSGAKRAKEENKQLSVHLPVTFVEKFKSYVKAKNEKMSGIKTITEREVIYEALEVFMASNKT